MADGIETFSAEKNWNRVKAGFQGGPFWQRPGAWPEHPFVDGWPAGVAEKLNAPQSVSQPTPIDSWNTRKPGNK